MNIDIKEYDLKKHKNFLFPSIRSEEMVQTLIKDFPKEEHLIVDKELGDLRTLYFLWKDGYNVPINTTLLSIGEGISTEEIKTYAHKNLEKQGWIPHKETGEMQSGILYQFDENKKLYHSQFFKKEWVEKYIGTEFYFGFPTKEIAYVFVQKKNAKVNKFLFDRNHIHNNFIKEDYKSSRYPISKHLFSYRNGDYQIVL